MTRGVGGWGCGGGRASALVPPRHSPYQHVEVNRNAFELRESRGHPDGSRGVRGVREPLPSGCPNDIWMTPAEGELCSLGLHWFSKTPPGYDPTSLHCPQLPVSLSPQWEWNFPLIWEKMSSEGSENCYKFLKYQLHSLEHTSWFNLVEKLRVVLTSLL